MRENLSTTHWQRSRTIKNNALFSFLDSYLDLIILGKSLTVSIHYDIRSLGSDIDRDGFFTVKNTICRLIGASDGKMHLIISWFIKGCIDDRSDTDSRIIAVSVSIISIIISTRYSIIGRIYT